MAKRSKRQFVLMPGASPMGSLSDVRERLGDFNTAADGGPAKSYGTEFLYGPGYSVELPTGAEQVTQAIVSVNDDELALPVLMRMCKARGWKLVDIESGRTFGG